MNIDTFNYKTYALLYIKDNNLYQIIIIRLWWYMYIWTYISSLTIYKIQNLLSYMYV